MYRPSPDALYSPLMEQRKWIDNTVAAGASAKLMTSSSDPSANPDGPMMESIPTQQAAIYSKPLVFITVQLLLILAIFSRILKRRAQA